MLNTTLLFAMKLAFRYAAFTSAGLRQRARLASAYQARSGTSASGCLLQNTRKALSAIIRMTERYHAPNLGASPGRSLRNWSGGFTEPVLETVWRDPRWRDRT